MLSNNASKTDEDKRQIDRIRVYPIVTSYIILRIDCHDILIT